MFTRTGPLAPDGRAAPYQPDARGVLYSFRRCPYAIRARLALASSGQRVELREVVLRDKPAALLQASPQGTVPVLVLPEGTVLEHSLDIMLWALGRHDPGRWLQPPHGTLDAMLALIAECDGPFKQALDRCKYPNRYPGSDPTAERAAAQAWLEQLEGRLQARGPWLGGSHAALADMAIAPFVRQFAGIDAAHWQSLPCPRVRAWLQQWLADPLFARVMGKQGAWAPGDAPGFFPPA